MKEKNFSEKKFKTLFGIEKKEISHKIIISPFFNNKIFKEKLEEPKNFKGLLFYGINGMHKGEKISYINTGIGQEFVVDCVLGLANKKDCKIIFLGAVGAVKDLSFGECVYIEKAFFDITYYKKFGIGINDASLIFKPDLNFADLSLRLAQRKGINLKNVSLISLHSLWDQNEDLIKNIKEKNIQTIDLECALFYAAAEKSQIKSIALCYVSDLILSRPFWQKFSPDERKKIQKCTACLTELALATLIS
ncbi:MAG: hypothetical protein ABIG64_06660 [Candidatus Omnitrophota bacterium]